MVLLSFCWALMSGCVRHIRMSSESLSTEIMNWIKTINRSSYYFVKLATDKNCTANQKWLSSIILKPGPGLWLLLITFNPLTLICLRFQGLMSWLPILLLSSVIHSSNSGIHFYCNFSYLWILNRSLMLILLTHNCHHEIFTLNPLLRKCSYNQGPIS